MVIANQEENRELDVRRLRDRGIRVEVTEIETVPEAVETFKHLFDDVLGWERPDWLAEAERAVVRRPPTGDHDGRDRDLARPVDGGRPGHLHRRPGAPARLAERLRRRPDRYPTVDVEDLDGAGADVLLLPDEPYVFTAEDGPEAFTRTPTQLVSGRLLTWYGPSLLEAHAALAAG